MNQTVPRCPKCCKDLPPPTAPTPNATNGDNTGVVKDAPSIASSSTASADAVSNKEVSKTTLNETIAPSKTLRALRSRGSLKVANAAANTGGLIHSVMKPDIVFFGEGLPFEFHSSLQEDIKVTDLVLVMGSSLKVRPVSHIPSRFSVM